MAVLNSSHCQLFGILDGQSTSTNLQVNTYSVSHMFYESSVYSSFAPIYYLSKATGTMPLQIVYAPRNGYTRNKSCLIYSVSFLTLSILHGMATPYFAGGNTKTASTLATSVDISKNTSDSGSYRNQTTFEMVAMRTMNTLIVCFMSTASLAISLTLIRTNLPMFFEDLTQADRLLNTVLKLNLKHDYKISISLVIYFLSLTCLSSVYYLWTSYIAVQDWEFFWNLLLVVDNVSSFAAEIQFTTLAFYLHFRFKMINRFLKHQIGAHSVDNYFWIRK